MAVSYTIDTASGLSSSAVSGLLARLPDFAQTVNGLAAPDLLISIWEPSALASSIIEEAFGFRPKLEVDFRVDDLRDGAAAVDRILRATAALLRDTAEDTALLLNGESVVLTRLQGRLLLYSIPRFWTDVRLKLMPEPSGFMDPVIL